jgi:hypothetical protein
MTSIEEYTKENVVTALKSSRTFVGAAVKLGLITPTGKNNPATEENIFDALMELHLIMRHHGIKNDILGTANSHQADIVCPHCHKKI